MSIKRTIITTILALALVATVAPATTQATTIDDLLAQISALQAQLVALQGGSTPVPTGIVACSGVTFTRDLTVGSTGSDVKCLQVLLNTNGYTLAATGAGSPGMETSYFGPRTLAVIRAFQAAKGWTPANQVGPLTRAALNALITGTSTTPVTGLPTGCTSTSGFSPVTGASCATGVTTTITTPGATGYLSVDTLAASPASNANVTATSNIPVLGVNVKAIGSDIKVSSAKVQLAVIKDPTGTPAAEHPATAVQNLYVYDGSTLLGTFPINTSTVIKTTTNGAGTTGTYYYVILSGFNFVVPANTTKVLTVTADFASALETSRQLTINLFDTTSVRGVDGTGASITAGVTSTRVFTVAYATVGTSTLTVSTDATVLKSTSVKVNHTSGTTDVPMFVFQARSATGPSTITDLKFTATGAGVTNLTAVKLYDGSTLLGSQALSSQASGATATFSDLSIAVAKDTTKTLTVKADFSADVAGAGEAVLLKIFKPSTDVTYQLPNLTSTNPASTTPVTGNAMHLYDGVVTTFSLVSATSAYVPNSTTPSLGYTTGTITLRAHSDGGITTEPAVGSFTVTYGKNGTDTTLAVASKTITVTPDSTIGDGNDATVVLNLQEPVGTSGTGFIDFRIGNISWSVTNGVQTETEATQTWGLDDFKTPTAGAF